MKLSLFLFLSILTFTILLTTTHSQEDRKTYVKHVKGKKLCKKEGWECNTWSRYCCNLTISDYFQAYQFENLFSKRNTPVAHAVGFWDYRSFILAAALFEPIGFGTTGNKTLQMMEIAAFLGHVGSKTSCGYGVATGGPYAWGLCYNKEMSPSQSYCDDYFKLTYPCAPGAEYYGRGALPVYWYVVRACTLVLCQSTGTYPCAPGAEYYGRGALPVYWNYNYGITGEALKADLLNHPEYIEQNATLAFQAAIWRWMTPIKKGQPSAHEAFVGEWKPTKNDTESKRAPGFGATMNILYGDLTCGQGEVESMSNIISHYLYYLDLMGVGREQIGPDEVLTCAEQKPFNPSPKSPSATSS